MRNKPICNVNYCQLLSQNGYVENITLSEIIVCYFHVFTLRIHPDTSVVKAVTSKYELYFSVISDRLTATRTQKMFLYPKLEKTSLICCIQILPQEQFSWAKQLLLSRIREFMSWAINNDLNYKRVDKSIYLTFNELNKATKKHCINCCHYQSCPVLSWICS